MWFALVLACTIPETDPDPTGTTPTSTPMDVGVDPPVVAFGEVGAGSAATEVVTLANRGTEIVTLLAVTTTTTEVAAEPGGPTVLPGASDPVTLTWTPVAPGPLGATLTLRVESASGEIRELDVPLSGTALGPVLEISTGAIDLGTVLVGCEGTADLTLQNTGTGVLEIDQLGFVEGGYLVARASDGSPLPAPPLLLAGGESLGVQLAFAPHEEGYVADILRVASNDDVSPVVDVQASALGQIEAANSLEFDPVRKENVTALFAVNAVLRNQYYDAFIEALPTLFDSLQAAEVDYRLAFTIIEAGTIDGYLPYVDNSLSTADSVIAVDDMIADAGGDLDTMFETLDNAITANQDWLLDDDSLWAESSLNLIGVNNDVEQSSGGNYVVYLGQYRAFKEDPADIVIHGIGGDVPRGCSTAEPAQGFYDAAAATGGTFASICAEDWVPTMEALAEGFLGEHQVFVLTGDPAEWSIEVYIDDIRVTSGWTYSEIDQTITFDDETYPGVGSVVRVDYIMNVECP